MGIDTTCSCQEHSIGFSVDSFSIANELDIITELVPMSGITTRTGERARELDLQVHRFSGSSNNIPLNALTLYSIRTQGEQNERRYVGRLGNTRIDYTLCASLSGTSQLNGTLTVNKPAGTGSNTLSYVYDFQNRWLLSSDPEPPETPDDDKSRSRTTAAAMIALAGGKGDVIFMSHSRIACILHIVIHVGGLCA